MDVWKDERMLRIKYEQRSSIQAFNVKVTEFGEYGKTRIKDLAVEYFTVDHKPVKYAYGFNFFQQKKKLTISGDTKPCENLMKYGQLADVLLHEVFIEDEIYSYFRMRTKKTLHNVKAYHTPSTIVGKVAKITRCKKTCVNTFLFQHNLMKKKLIDVVTKDFGKKPVIGKDTFKNNNLVAQLMKDLI